MSRRILLSSFALFAACSSAPSGLAGLMSGGGETGPPPELVATGAACAAAADCSSGFCVDGVCCESACGGGDRSDCQSCLGAETGGADGTCAPIKRYHQRPVTGETTFYDCRPPANNLGLRSPGLHVPYQYDVGGAALPGDLPCDTPESCDGVHLGCPADSKAPINTVTCREAVGDCDVAERCDGAHDACPADRLLNDGDSCRAQNACVLPGRCASGACMTSGVEAAGYTCAPPSSECYDWSMCDGAGTCKAIPAAAGTPCKKGAAVDSCGYCDGTGACGGTGTYDAYSLRCI